MNPQEQLDYPHVNPVNGKKYPFGLIFSGIVVFVLMCVFGYKWYDTHRELVAKTFHVERLQADSTSHKAIVLEERLGRLLAEKSLQETKDKSAISQANFDAGIAKANGEVDRRVATYNSKQLKKSADVPRAGVGVVATTEKDSSINRDFTILKDKYKVLEDSIPKLHKRIGVLEAQVSDLENELNGTKSQRDEAIKSSLYAEDKFLQESQTKRFLGSGRKKAMLEAASDVRKQRIGIKPNQ